MSSQLLALLVGCADGLDVRISTAPAMPSVLEVTWTRQGDGEAGVDFGEDLALQALAPPGQAGDRARVLLLGLPPGEPVRLQAFEALGPRTLRSGVLDAETGLLLDAPPALTLDALEPEAEDGRLLLTTTLGDWQGVTLLDRQGRTTWYFGLDEDRMVIDAELAIDGGGVWMLTQPDDMSGALDGLLRRVAWDGTVEIERSIHGAHHAFTQLGDGRLAVVERVEEVDDQGQPHINARVLLVDAEGEAEVLTDLWRIFPNYYGITGGAGPHANGLLHVPERQTLLWSFLGLSAVVEIDADSGDMLWGVGGLDHAMDWPEAAPTVLHAPSFTREGQLMIFDNGDPDRPASVRAFDVDHGAETLTEAWAHPWSGGEDILTLGHAREQHDGHLLVSWGMRGQLEELDGQGRRIWQVSAPAAVALGNVQRLEREGLDK